MAAARDQAARVLRTEPNSADNDSRHESPAVMADQIRAQLSDDPVARRPADVPEHPAVAPPAAPEAPAAAAAPKPARRRFVLIGVGALLALAAASYGVHYLLVGRFYVSTD